MKRGSERGLRRDSGRPSGHPFYFDVLLEIFGELLQAGAAEKPVVL